MTKEQLDKYLGKDVIVEFDDNDKICGILRYITVKLGRYTGITEGRYTVDIYAFKASHVKRITER